MKRPRGGRRPWRPRGRRRLWRPPSRGFTRKTPAPALGSGPGRWAMQRGGTADPARAREGWGAWEGQAGAEARNDFLSLPVEGRSVRALSERAQHTSPVRAAACWPARRRQSSAPWSWWA